MDSAELMWMPLRSLAAALDARTVSAREALQAHFDRIDEVNPLINAVITQDRGRAFERAHLIDEVRATGSLPDGVELRGEERDGRFVLHPLAGVPMTHKDTHLTAGMRTTFGSPIRKDYVSSENSPIIARLQRCGVVGTGKTNVPEFAAGAHTFNPLFGTTVNPYDRQRSAAGSSGGVAAAIATGIQPAGDGSDTGGSLRLPASFNNLVGLRPTGGWIPHAYPENPFEWLTQSGFIARFAADIAFLMAAVSDGHPAGGPWASQESFAGGEFSADGRGAAAGESAPLAGVRIGFSPTLGGRLDIEKSVADVVAPAGQVLSSLGADVGDAIIDLSSAREVFRTARAYEFALNYGHLMGEYAELMKPALRTNIQAGLDLRIEDMFSAERARGRLLRACQEYFEHHDALITVTNQVEPFDASAEFPTHINGRAMTDYLEWMDSTTLISATGLPAVSVPSGFTESGLPVGMQIIGAHGDDAGILRIAHVFQQATGYAERRPVLGESSG